MTKTLTITPNLDDYDEVYQCIIDMHQGMSDEESQNANAKLILVLANHIGDKNVIAQAADVARENTLAWRDE